jgi:hypothetical protein
MGARQKVRRHPSGLKRSPIKIARHREEAFGLDEPAIRKLRQPTGAKRFCEMAATGFDRE